MVPKSKTKKAFTPPAGGYETLVKEALLHLDERTGSSPYAIIKYLDTEYRAIGEDKLKIQVKHALKRMIDKGLIVRIKNSYKLTPKGKAAPKPKAAAAPAAAKKVAAKKVIKKVEKKTAPAKKVAKTTTKRAAASKTRKAAAAKPKKTITKSRRAPAKGRSTKRTSSRRK